MSVSSNTLGESCSDPWFREWNHNVHLKAALNADEGYSTGTEGRQETQATGNMSIIQWVRSICESINDIAYNTVV